MTIQGERHLAAKIGFVSLALILLAAPGATQKQGPRIFFSDLESGPNTGGEGNRGAYITIFGVNFGAARGSSTVTVGGGEASAYPVWSDRKITFQLGPNAQSGAINVVTAAGTSNGVPFEVRPGRIVFASPSGADHGNGGFGSPWRTLTMAKKSMHAGDIAYLMDGFNAATDDGEGWDAVFMLRGFWCSAGPPRALVAYPGAKVTLGSPTGVRAIRSPDPSAGGGACAGNWTFSQLQLRGKNDAVSLGGPSGNWRIVGNDFSCPNGNEASACFTTDRASNVKFYGNNVHDAGLAGPPTASALYHGVYFSRDSNHIDMGWNVISNIHGCRGVQFHSSDGENQYDIHVHDNLIHGTQCDGIVFATVDPSKGPVEVYNNVIYDAGQGPNNPERTGGWTCVNVTGGTNRGAPGGGTIEIYNNTMYNCGGFQNPPYDGANGGVTNGGHNIHLKIDLRNNIIFQLNRTAPCWVNHSQEADGIFGSNNLCDGGGDPLPAPHMSKTISRDPLFVNAHERDFHLIPDSPARSAGIAAGLLTDKDGNPRTGKAGDDLGAYQDR